MHRCSQMSRGVNLRHDHEKLRSGAYTSRDSDRPAGRRLDSPPARPGPAICRQLRLSFISATMRLRRPAAQRLTSPNGRRVTSTSLIAVRQSISQRTSFRMSSSRSLNPTARPKLAQVEFHFVYAQNAFQHLNQYKKINR